MGNRAQTALLFPFLVRKRKETCLFSPSCLGKAGSAIELRLLYVTFSLWDKSFITWAHWTASSSQPAGSENYFCTGVRAIAVLLYSELVFVFFWFAHTNVKAVLGLACLGIGCNMEADCEHSRYKGSAL